MTPFLDLTVSLNKLFTNRDFIFISHCIDRLNKNDDILLHIINVHIVVVLIQNVNVKNVYLFKNCRINIIQNYVEKNCFLTNLKKISLTINFEIHKSAFKD